MCCSFLTEAFNDVTHGLHDHAEDEYPTARPGDQQYTVSVPVQCGVAVLGRGLSGIPLQAKDYYISCKTNVQSQIRCSCIRLFRTLLYCLLYVQLIHFVRFEKDKEAKKENARKQKSFYEYNYAIVEKQL